MKITVKTLQQKVFQVCLIYEVLTANSCLRQIDADGAETVGDLKKKIQEIQGHTIESQKLIYSGKQSAIWPKIWVNTVV